METYFTPSLDLESIFANFPGITERSLGSITDTINAVISRIKKLVNEPIVETRKTT